MDKDWTAYWHSCWDRLKEINTLFRMFDLNAEVFYMEDGTDEPWHLDLRLYGDTARFWSFRTLEELNTKACECINSQQSTT